MFIPWFNPSLGKSTTRMLVAKSSEVGMNAWKLKIACLLIAISSSGWANAQSAMPAFADALGSPTTLNDSDDAGQLMPYTQATLSEWIIKPRDPGCCGPFGRKGPILLETYFRTGVDFPVGGGVFAQVLSPGWNVGGGGRSLFFNQEATKAWVLDLGVSNTHYNSNDRSNKISLFNLPYLDRSGQFGIGVNRSITLPAIDTGIVSLNQTFVNMSGGREIYFLGDALNKEKSCRAGFDVGGRYGTQSADLTNYPEMDKVVGAVFLAAHSDMQIPLGKAALMTGIRLEWDYSWSNIFQSQNNSELANIGLLFNFGLLF